MGKIGLITAANSGIGFATAKRFVAEGYVTGAGLLVDGGFAQV
jgi:NAD(P)-dependent dehydrogenase (short-subunit alcohol dehydrogenase family)